MDIPIKNMFVIGFVLLALVTAVSGLPTLDVSTDKAWLTAGGAGTATVTVQVNDDSNAVPGAQVTVSCSETMGTIAPGTLTTGADGRATATFTAGTVSGTATITAVFTDENGTPVSASVDLSIDHGTPIEISSLSCPDEGSVGGEIEIAKRIEGGLQSMMLAISASPAIMAEILACADKIAAGEIKVQQMDVQTCFFRHSNTNAKGAPRKK